MCPDSRPAAAPARRLFPPLAPDVAAALAAYPELLRRELALSPGMERAMPHAVRDLSLSLTAEREGGPKPGYLSEPRTLAAYAWYFLPWNLLRLSRLLPALPLEIPDDGLVCDLGAGPLTFLQALWLSRPDLREKRLRFLCVDRSRRALDLGLGLFRRLAGFDPAAPDAPWRVRLVRGEYWQGLSEDASLVALVNLANELGGGVREPLDARMGRLAGQVADALVPGGRALIVEPGTRLGWRCLLGLREAFLEMGLGLDAPCPHGEECSLLAAHTRAWCHFTMSPAGAPGWLAALSERLRLGKTRLSLSFLLAAKQPPAFAANTVRVVSGAFSLADAPGAAVYGCSPEGLVVLQVPDGRAPRPGDAVTLPVPEGAPRDPKSGAPRLVLPGHDRSAAADAPAAPRDRAERPARGAGEGDAPRPANRPARKGPPGPGAPSRNGRPGGKGKNSRPPRGSRGGASGGPSRPASGDAAGAPRPLKRVSRKRTD